MRRTVTAISALHDDVPAMYRPGALSRFLAWVDTLPLHGWWVFAAYWALLVISAHMVLWGSGLLAVGSIDRSIAVGVPYGPFALAGLAYLNGVAKRAVAAFWPATGWPEADRAAWTYRFVTTPGGYGWLCLGIGIALALGSFALAPTTALATGPTDRAVLLVAYFPSLIAGYAALPMGIIHIGRQLRLVARIHREALAIDPFDRAPLYAFSWLTAQAGLLFLIITYYSLTVNGAFQQGNVVSLAGLAVGFLTGAACFVVPLWGIHGRLVTEKDRLLGDVDQRAARLGAEMFARIDAGAFDATKAVSDGLTGVGALRERITRLPTWPWPPQLFRGFLSALLLPVVVYVVSRIVGGQIGI
jgi:hypothetical protein